MDALAILVVLLCFRAVLRGRGTVGQGSVPGIQQADPTRTEHDAEGGRTLRSRLRPAHQRREYSSQVFLLINSGNNRFPEIKNCIFYLQRWKDY